jgi:hypothetical protein
MAGKVAPVPSRRFLGRLIRQRFGVDHQLVEAVDLRAWSVVGPAAPS